MASNSSRERAQRTAELLKQQQQQAKRRQAGIVGGIMAVLLIVAVGGGWFLLKSDDQPVKPKDSQYGLGVGDDNAPVHMIIYEDFLCPACGYVESQTHEQLQAAADAGKVHLEYRPFNFLQTDYSVQADVFRFFDRFTLMGTLGYSLRGDPQGYELDDTPYASVGGSWSWRDGASIAAFYDYRAAAYAGAPASSELSGSVTAPLGRRGRAEFYVSTGLSDGSPDWSAGLSLRVAY